MEHDCTDRIDQSAERVLSREIAAVAAWLTAQGLDFADSARADEGSRDYLYWRFGYFSGMKHALALLTSRGATVH
jgi:hypothetical protein